VTRALVISDAVASLELIIVSGDLVRGALTAAGFTHIDRARSIHEAAPLITKLQPDLVVLDMVEPQTFESYRRLIARLRGTPLLAIVPEEGMSAAFDAGIDDCLARPVRTTELVARARAAIRLRIERVRRTRRDRRLSEELRVLQEEKHELERIACVDSLTGVANRRHTMALLDAEWKRSMRDGTPLSMVIVDIDHFHAYNETYGHPGGDACLRKVTAEIATCLRRPSDYVGRYGGEEFIAVLANTDASGARIVAERVRYAVERLAIPHSTSSCSRYVTISVGFATMLPKSEHGVEMLIKAADSALLRAKASGRNRISGDAPTTPSRPRISSHPWRRFPAVVLDPWYADRIPTFLATARNEIEVLREALELGALDRVRVVARRLRGNAGDHNIPTIGELANLLDRAARTEDLEGIRRVIDELAQYVEHVVVQYRRPQERKLGHVG
jgi:two-component system, chemotaxis family, response regulator WspR